MFWPRELALAVSWDDSSASSSIMTGPLRRDRTTFAGVCGVSSSTVVSFKLPSRASYDSGKSTAQAEAWSPSPGLSGQHRRFLGQRSLGLPSYREKWVSPSSTPRRQFFQTLYLEDLKGAVATK